MIIYEATDKTPHLQHFKYIKRYRKNGKWRYIYPGSQAVNKFQKGVEHTVKALGDAIEDAVGVDEKKYAEATQEWVNNAEKKYKQSRKDVEDSLNNLQKVRRENFEKDGYDTLTSIANANLNTKKEIRDAARRDLAIKQAQADSAKKAYSKTVLGITEKAVNIGKSYVEQLIKEDRIEEQLIKEDKIKEKKKR